jgi:hypothetical protein
MGESNEHDDRSALLAFVERHWRDLTLREACALRVESIDRTASAAPVKASLIFR